MAKRKAKKIEPSLPIWGIAVDGDHPYVWHETFKTMEEAERQVSEKYHKVIRVWVVPAIMPAKPKRKKSVQPQVPRPTPAHEKTRREGRVDRR